MGIHKAPSYANLFISFLASILHSVSLTSGCGLLIKSSSSDRMAQFPHPVPWMSQWQLFHLIHLALFPVVIFPHIDVRLDNGNLHIFTHIKPTNLQHYFHSPSAILQLPSAVYPQSSKPPSSEVTLPPLSPNFTCPSAPCYQVPPPTHDTNPSSLISTY